MLVNHGPSQQSSKEMYKPGKWGINLWPVLVSLKFWSCFLFQIQLLRHTCSTWSKRKKYPVLNSHKLNLQQCFRPPPPKKKKKKKKWSEGGWGVLLISCIWVRNGTKPNSERQSCRTGLSDRIIIIIIYPLTVRVVGAPQMISQPVSSIFPCSPLPSQLGELQAVSYTHLTLPTTAEV